MARRMRQSVQGHLNRARIQLSEVHRLAQLGCWEWDILTDSVHDDDGAHSLRGRNRHARHRLPAIARRGEPKSSSVRVFIVDDSPFVRQRLVAMVRGVAETDVVGEAGTVAEALAAIPRFKPDLVFLDIRMPDGDGISVLQKLKAWVGAAIVARLTNYADDYHRHRSEAAGADLSPSSSI